MLLSSGKMSEHFSRSTCPVRQSSVTICSARWHRVMLSSVRKLMSLLLSHCTPEDPGARRFIWTAVRGCVVITRRGVQPVRGRRRRCALMRPDPCPARNGWQRRLARRVRSARRNNEASRCRWRWWWAGSEWGGAEVQPFAASNSRAPQLAGEPSQSVSCAPPQKRVTFCAHPRCSSRRNPPPPTI